MGDDDGADRNAANRARFEQLPPAGSPGYWAALEDMAQATRLELEVLAMCARERLAAGALREFERVYTILIGKTEAKLLAWANTLIPTGVRNRAQIIEELMQECRLELWRELDSPDPTFLTKGYWIRMRRMLTNLAAQTRIAEGLSARTGVIKPTRVPVRELHRLDEAVGPEDERTPSDLLTDPRAHEAYGLAEMVIDLAAVASHLDADEQLLLWNEITRTYTQAHLGEILGITDRAVRDRLKALHAKLKALLDPEGQSDSAATDGGEGQHG